MAENSKIEWTDHTANFWWGCLKVSPGCEHCYADTLAHRWGKDIWGPAKTTSRELKKGVWANVIKWNDEARASGTRRKVFCMSMGDFFEDHPQVTEWRDEALDLISRCTYLDWQILTKRPENVNGMIETSRSHSFSDADMWFYANPHVWIGTSVENQEQADKRIPELLGISAAVRFLSMEPLLGPVDLTKLKSNYDGENRPLLRHNALRGGHWVGDAKAGFWGSEDDLDPPARIHWVIVGGESGPNARPMHPDWARSLRDQCNAAGVPFFFKQWGEWVPNGQQSDHKKPSVVRWPIDSPPVGKVGKKSAGRLLDGRTWDEFPAVGGE